MRRDEPGLRRLVAALTVAALIGGCSGSDEGASPTSRSDTSQAQNQESVCAPFLEFLATGFEIPTTMSNVRASLPSTAPREVTEAADALVSAAEGQSAYDAAAEPIVEEWVLNECRDEYRSEVEPSPTSQEAVRTLFQAVVEGNESAATTVATANVLAVFSPWAPIEADAANGLPAMSGDADRFRLELTSEVTFTCDAEDGVVVVCDLEQPYP